MDPTPKLHALDGSGSLFPNGLNACSFQLPCLLLNEVTLKGMDPTPKVHALDSSGSLIPVS